MVLVIAHHLVMDYYDLSNSSYKTKQKECLRYQKFTYIHVVSWFSSDDNIDGNNNSGYLQGVRLSSIELLDNFKTPITHLPTAEKRSNFLLYWLLMYFLFYKIIIWALYSMNQRHKCVWVPHFYTILPTWGLATSWS